MQGNLYYHTDNDGDLQEGFEFSLELVEPLPQGQDDSSDGDVIAGANILLERTLT